MQRVPWTANIILSGKTLNAFLQLETKQEAVISPFLISLMHVVVTAFKKQKHLKIIDYKGILNLLL